MAIACLLGYWIMTRTLSGIADEASAFFGRVWAAVATVFVFWDTRARSLSAGIGRLIATCVSFALCLAYLLPLPFAPVGTAVLIGLGTAAMMLLGWRDDIVTASITTAVVMVLVAMSPSEAWHQSELRFFDTLVGIGIGVACAWAGSFLFCRFAGKPAS